MASFSVFVAESASAFDFYTGRVDGFAANEVLKLQRVCSTYRIAMTEPLLSKAVRHAIAGDFSVFHLSCHGDEDGVRLTDGSDVSWPALAGILKPLSSERRMLVMSCCSGGYVGLSKALQKEGTTFGYLFGSTHQDGVDYTHACLAWSVLHNRMVEEATSRQAMRRTIDKINLLVPGDFVYRRWDGSAYRTYPDFKPEGPSPGGRGRATRASSRPAETS